MTILSAQSIRERCHPPYDEHGTLPLISPFHERYVIHGRSAGLDCAGYCLVLKKTLWLWPFWMRVTPVDHYFVIPNDLKMTVADKSTNIRSGFCCFNTRAEPGWFGELMVELLRVKPWPIRLKKGTPVAVAEFLKLDHPTDHPYPADGKYQGQTGTVGPRYEKDTR